MELIASMYCNLDTLNTTTYAVMWRLPNVLYIGLSLWNLCYWVLPSDKPSRLFRSVSVFHDLKTLGGIVSS
jgi:hypothetical protein